MKKSLILVGLLVGSISAIANDNSSKYYLGMGMVSGSGTYTESMSEYSFDSSSFEESINEYSYDSSSMPIKFGMMLDNDNRFEFSYEKEKHKFTKIGVDKKISGFNFDWNFAYPKYKIADAVTPYWTLGLGYYTYEDSANFGDNEDDLKGTAFNYGIGGLYEINKNIELEASYKFKAISWDSYTKSKTDITYRSANNYTITETTSTILSDLVGSLFYLGLNYKL
jgi:opacity protein-like surface antigen